MVSTGWYFDKKQWILRWTGDLYYHRSWWMTQLLRYYHVVCRSEGLLEISPVWWRWHIVLPSGNKGMIDSSIVWHWVSSDLESLCKIVYSVNTYSKHKVNRTVVEDMKFMVHGYWPLYIGYSNFQLTTDSIEIIVQLFSTIHILHLPCDTTKVWCAPMMRFADSMIDGWTIITKKCRC